MNGLPEVCMDAETFKIFEGKTSVNSGEMNLECDIKGNSNGNSNRPWKIADVLLPQGTTVTETNEDTGKSTHYVLKATSVTQMMKGVDVSQCMNVKPAPDTAKIPTIATHFGTMTMAEYPAETPLLKVEAGVVIADTVEINTQLATPAPGSSP